MSEQPTTEEEFQERSEVLESHFFRLSQIQTESEFWLSLEELQREIHTLKGLCGFAGREDAAQEIHDLETRLKALQSDGEEPNSYLRLLDSRLPALLELLRITEVAPEETVAEPEQLDWLKAQLGEDTKRILESLARDQVPISHIVFDREGAHGTLADLRRIFREKSRILAAVPEVQDHSVRFHFLIKGFSGLDALVQEWGLGCQPFHQVTPEPQERGESPAAAPPEKDPLPGNQVRIEKRRLDLVDRLSADLAAHYWRLKHEEGLEGDAWQGFEAALKRLRQSVLDTRLIRLSSIWQRFPLELRQLAARLDKDVRLSFSGSTLELDRNIAQGLVEPLRHLLINAVAHGIEPVGARKGQSKPPTGEVSVECRLDGSFLVLAIRDDGRGIDRAEISRACGRELNTDTEVLQQLCQRGWTSREEATLDAGRGLGLDIVSRELARIRGSLDLETEPGKGTCFTITVPTTLTVRTVLEVPFEDTTLVFPQDSIRRLIEIDERSVQSIQGREVLFHPRGAIPLFDLCGLLNLSAPSELPRSHGLVCRGLTGTVVFRIPSPGKMREVIVQPCQSRILNRGWLDGVTSSGGRVAFLVSVQGLIERAHCDN